MSSSDGESRSPTRPASLAGSRTHALLRQAFSREAESSGRFLYFAKIAEIEGHVELARLYRDAAESRTGHAHGHLDWLMEVGDPLTGLPIGDSEDNLRAAIAAEQADAQALYAEAAGAARSEGFRDIAQWFETLARAEDAHARRFGDALDDLD